MMFVEPYFILEVNSTKFLDDRKIEFEGGLVVYEENNLGGHIVYVQRKLYWEQRGLAFQISTF